MGILLILLVIVLVLLILLVIVVLKAGEKSQNNPKILLIHYFCDNIVSVSATETGAPFVVETSGGLL